MNTKALNSLADLICRAQEQDRTPMGIAFAVEAAGRHMSPETAAELERLRARVAELETGLPVVQTALFKALDRVSELENERHSTNEWVTDAAEALRGQRDRIAALEQGPALPWAQPMSDDDLHDFLGDLVSAAMGRWQHSPEVPDREVLAAVEKACAAWRTPGQGLRSDEAEAEPDEDVSPQVAKLRSLLAGQREAVEGEHYAVVHHAYRVGRDLPETGGA
ncbi:hypothetical protein [Streptomyces sp. NPDC002132]|uniref:hypothetical protein n=1 Tax=unclassified Streptomyces TaxID=2593676 RepID=UPI00331A0F8F